MDAETALPGGVAALARGIAPHGERLLEPDRIHLNRFRDAD